MRFTKIKLPDSLWKMIIALAAIVVIFSFLVRMLSGSETLADYANKHPEQQITTSANYEEADVEKNSETEKMTEATVEIETVTEEIETDIEENETVIEEAGFPMDEEVIGDRVIYAEGFYYEPIPEAIRKRMTGVSYPDGIDESKVCWDDLRYLVIKYHNFQDEEVVGELVCNAAIADDMIEIFYELNRNAYQLESVRLIDDFDADDTASMAANNTSSFCYRVVDGSTHLSNHAYGRAIDVNPFYNPYVVFKAGEDDYISPPGSEIYVDRSQSFPYKIDESDLCYRLFIEHGFTWGGNWNSCKDYQHFEKKASN